MLETGSILVQIEDEWFSRGSSFWGYGIWLFNLLINFFAIILLHLLLGKTLKKIVSHSYSDRFTVFVTGVVYLFGIPLLGVFCLTSFTGIPFGILLLSLFLLSLWLGNCLAALLLTHYLNSRNVYPWNFWTIILLSLAIVTVVDLLVLFPILGIIVYLLILAFTYGMIILYVRDTQLNNYELIQ